MIRISPPGLRVVVQKGCVPKLFTNCRSPCRPSRACAASWRAAAQLNFRRAAQEVGLTPTAFSERISGLEGELDRQLFQRTSRHVELTDAGQALLPFAERALVQVRACVDVLTEPERREVRLRIGTRFELGMSWLLPAVMALEKARPNWQIDLYCGASADILERLNGGLLDAIVTSSPIAAATHIAQVLHPETYELVASRRLAARLPVREIVDCKAHTLLDLDEGLPLARYLTSAAPGIEFARVRFCGTAGIVIARARAGDGVAVLPSYMVKRELKGRHLLRLLPKVALFADSFRLISRKGSRANEPLAALAEYLRGRELR